MEYGPQAQMLKYMQAVGKWYETDKVVGRMIDIKHRDQWMFSVSGAKMPHFSRFSINAWDYYVWEEICEKFQGLVIDTETPGVKVAVGQLTVTYTYGNKTESVSSEVGLFYLVDSGGYERLEAWKDYTVEEVVPASQKSYFSTYTGRPEKVNRAFIGQ